MCGRFALGVSASDLPSQFHQTALLNDTNNNELTAVSPTVFKCGEDQINVASLAGFESSYNIAPSDTAVIVYLVNNSGNTGGTYVMEQSQFGLVPPWAKPKARESKDIAKELMVMHGKYFNCRKDTLAIGSTWAQSRRSRCVVPMQGYFEWSKNAATKVPYFVHSSTAPLIYFAGLYCHNTHYATKKQYTSTFTIVTGPAEKDETGDLSWLHPRKPILLSPGTPEWQQWLDPRVVWSDKLLETCLKTDKPGYADIVAYTVSSDVGKTASEGEYLTQEVKREPKKESQKSITSFFKRAPQEDENSAKRVKTE